MQAIGVDADQAYLGPQVMTSALKKVDVAVFDSIKAVQDGTFKGGTDVIFELKNDGVGLGKTQRRAGSALKADRSTRSAADIEGGEISDIPSGGQRQLVHRSGRVACQRVRARSRSSSAASPSASGRLVANDAIDFELRERRDPRAARARTARASRR